MTIDPDAFKGEASYSDWMHQLDLFDEDAKKLLNRPLKVFFIVRPVDKQRVVALRTDAPVADLNELGRREVVVADIALPRHADHLR